MFKPKSVLASSIKLAGAGVLCVGLCAHPAFASKDDFQKQILVDSKHQSTDGVRKILTFSEDVHITQGSLIINADKVQVLREEGEGSEIFVATGQPADYQQSMEDGGTVKAEANEISYDKAKRLLVMTGNARLTMNNNISGQPDVTTVEGDSITFNMELEIMEAASSDNGEGRVRTTFQPSPQEDDTQDDKGTP